MRKASIWRTMYIHALTDHLLQLLKIRDFFALEISVQGHLGPIFPTASGHCPAEVGHYEHFWIYILKELGKHKHGEDRERISSWLKGVMCSCDELKWSQPVWLCWALTCGRSSPVFLSSQRCCKSFVHLPGNSCWRCWLKANEPGEILDLLKDALTRRIPGKR